MENTLYRHGLLVEPVVQWDNEVSCMSVGGGRLIAISSKGGGQVCGAFAAAARGNSHRPVDPLFLIDGVAPMHIIVSDAERDAYQITKGETIGPAPSEMLLEQVDASGRQLWEVLRDTIRTVVGDVRLTRVDFFVRYGLDGSPPSVVINEVEHGFDPQGLKNRFGRKVAEVVVKAWLLTAASNEEREQFVKEQMLLGQ
jgi:hypothetical protein